MDIATLRARLMKDSALRARGSERSVLLSGAADIYEAVYRREQASRNPEAYYPATNAATLRLLAGERSAAADLARLTLQALAEVPPDRSGYYECVSALEAHLVLGHSDRAREIVASISTEKHWNSEADYRALASTLRQLRLVLAANALPADCLQKLTMPRVIHFAGHIIAAPGEIGRFTADQEDAVRQDIEAELDQSRIGFGYGSLAAGADILFAEALLRRGAGLHVILPFREEEFIDLSVRPAGEGWVARYWACRQAAASVRFATMDRYLGEDQLFTYCSKLAIGLAVLMARHLSTEAEQLVVWDGEPASGIAGTAIDVETWRRTGLGQRTIACSATSAQVRPVRPAVHLDEGRRTHAMLFADLQGSTKLSDEAIPRFTDVVLGAFARVIDRYEDILLTNTWGDALFVVFKDAGQAAACALDLQEAMAAIDLAACGLPPHLALRIGVHLGPVHTSYDPILKKLNFFGAHVNRAARIEPVTPEGCVYVTEMMAAVLAIYNANQFCCDYVGYTEAAKNFGAMRMFLLRRRS